MHRLSPELFNPLIVSWAKAEFAEQVRTGFHRMSLFDYPSTKENIAVLRDRPEEELRVLSDVLPLGVFWETPEAKRRRDALPDFARQAVEKLRSDYDEAYQRKWHKNVQRIGGRMDQREFRAAIKNGYSVLKSVASERNCAIETAGDGEWGLIREQYWGRSVVTLNLKRNLLLAYSLSIFDSELMRIRCNDEYLAVLGIGAGAWSVENASQCAIKLVNAIEFSFWHLGEYEKMVQDAEL